VAVARVLAEAHVRDQGQRQLLAREQAQRRWHRAALVGGAAAVVLLDVGDSEQKDAPDAERGQAVGFSDGEVGTHS
jgi:hypothetical protein